MPGQAIRLGIIGCGGIARNRHIPGLTALRRAELSAVEVTALCDSSEENLAEAERQVQADHGTKPALYRDWQDLIAHAPVDAVDICLPHGLHHVVGIAALDAGLHVALEKPYTVTVKTGRRLAEAADRAGKALATLAPHRRMPGQRAVEWAINEGGLIGQPRLFSATYTQYRPPTPGALERPPMVWRRDRLMGGGANIIDSGFHFLDTVRYFFGEPETVYAELRAFDPVGPGGPRDIIGAREDTAVVTISFKNGVVGTWCWSFAVPGTEMRSIVLYGSDGSIEDTNYSNRYVIYHLFMGGGEWRGRGGDYLSMEELQARHRQAVGPERWGRLYPAGITDHFATELWDFLDAVEHGRRPEVDGWGGLATIGLVEAIYESALAGRSVRVDEVLAGTSPQGWQRDLDEHWDAQPIPRITRATGDA